MTSSSPAPAPGPPSVDVVLPRTDEAAALPWAPRRIRPPFAFRLLPAAAFLPGPRVWPTGRAVLAPLLDRLPLTGR